MDFIEERTPAGYSLKILLKRWKCMVFDKKGKPIYSDSDNKIMLHHIPYILFLGKNFNIKKDYEKEYLLLKIRNGVMILPYVDRIRKETEYIFLPDTSNLDMRPVRVIHFADLQSLVKKIEAKTSFDYIITGEEIDDNDIIIIKNRYQAEEIITYRSIINKSARVEEEEEDDSYSFLNLNMMSMNPVFLARIHLRSMDLAKINQLLLDFEITALDTEYILYFINSILNGPEKPEWIERKTMLNKLKDFYHFYYHLLQKNDDDVLSMVNAQTDSRDLAPFRTLISKVKSIYPGKEEQLLYTEYENMVLERLEEIVSDSSGPSRKLESGADIEVIPAESVEVIQEAEQDEAPEDITQFIISEETAV